MPTTRKIGPPRPLSVYIHYRGDFAMVVRAWPAWTTACPLHGPGCRLWTNPTYPELGAVRMCQANTDRDGVYAELFGA